MIVIGEVFYLLNCRSFSRSLLSVGIFSNPLVWLGSALMVGAQLLFTYLPLFNRLFETEPMRIEAWGFVLGLAVAIFLVVGMEKCGSGHASFLERGRGRLPRRDGVGPSHPGQG
jgi:cation-transporting ATPase F